MPSTATSSVVATRFALTACTACTTCIAYAACTTCTSTVRTTCTADSQIGHEAVYLCALQVVRLLQAADGLHDAVVELLPPFRAGFLFYDTRVGDGDLDRQGVPHALRALSLKGACLHGVRSVIGWRVGLNTNARVADRQEVGGVVLKVRAHCVPTQSNSLLLYRTHCCSMCWCVWAAVSWIELQ